MLVNNNDQIQLSESEEVTRIRTVPAFVHLANRRRCVTHSIHVEYCASIQWDGCYLVSALTGGGLQAHQGPGLLLY